MKYREKKFQIETLAAVRKKNRIEAFKQVFELLKHMTTLSSGSILLLVTFMEKILKGTAAPLSIGIAFFCFCVSILAALSTMFFLAMHREEIVTDGEANFFAVTVVLATAGFFIGIGSLAYTAYPLF